jgi:hypothetical protein
MRTDAINKLRTAQTALTFDLISEAVAAQSGEDLDILRTPEPELFYHFATIESPELNQPRKTGMHQYGRRRLSVGEMTFKPKKPRTGGLGSRMEMRRRWGKSIVLASNEFAASRIPARSMPANPCSSKQKHPAGT